MRGSGLPRAKRGYLSYTIFIVDDNATVRHALRSCIEQTGDWQVCGEADNGKVAVEKVRELHPDVVILDFQMPGMEGLEAAAQINVIAPTTAMLMFTMHNSEQLLKIAPAAGIREVLSKSDKLAEHLLISLKGLKLERGDDQSIRASR
jgi:DNA-binding NarL/FixJ family response regulator